MKAVRKRNYQISSVLMIILIMFFVSACTKNQMSQNDDNQTQSTPQPSEIESQPDTQPDNSINSENETNVNDPAGNQDDVTNDQASDDNSIAIDDIVTEETNHDLLTQVEDRIRADSTKYHSYTINQILMPDHKSVVSLFETPESNSEELLNYCVDIWISNETTDTIFMENLYILSSTFGISQIDDTEYFRFDYAYATDLQTVLLLIEDGSVTNALVLPGQMLSCEGKDIIVSVSTYNSIYLKEEEYSIGHTWNPYYFYKKDESIVEYQGEVITQEMFMDYVNAEEILTAINAMYDQDGIKLSYEYILRSNHLLHINIKCESDATINYYYETYEVREDHSLKFLLRGEGRYETEISSKKDNQ